MEKKHIVVLGAGYGGLMTVTGLQKMIGNAEATITLVNNNDYHYEATWLHELAAGTKTADQVRYAVMDVINPAKVNFIKDTVEKVNIEEKKVILHHEELSYDYLVVALGFESETFGIKGLQEHAFSMTNVHTAAKIRDQIENQVKAYKSEQDKKDERLTIVVGGAGFTGIEFIGELANSMPKLLRDHEVDPSKLQIICVEAAPTALPGFAPELVEYAVSQLQKKGITFQLGTAIKECTEEGILVEKDGETKLIKAGTVVWAAGVRGSKVVENSNLENVRGKVKVDEYLRLPGHETIFVIGDNSLVINKENDRPYPPTAQIAMQQGQNVAKNIKTLVKGNNELKPFVFDNKGTVCSLGHNDAIGLVFGNKIKGRFASLMKKVVDNRSLFMIGGPNLVLKKGKFRFQKTIVFGGFFLFNWMELLAYRN